MARTIFFICVFVTFLEQDFAQEPCAHFKLPTLKTREVIAQENTTINLPFQLAKQDCPANRTQDFKVRISKKDSLTHFRHICNIYHVNGICLNINDRTCRCNEDGSYMLVRALNRRDSTTWALVTDPAFAVKYELEFNIVYPSKVTSLTLTNGSNDTIEGAVPRYSMVNIACRLESGNPPRMPRLLGNVLPEPVRLPPGSKSIQHILPSVTCDKAGEIRCDVPGSSENKSVTLLVKCPPQFVDEDRKETYAVSEGESKCLQFHVRTHSTTIKKCRMTQEVAFHGKQRSEPRSKDCLKFTKLTGSPPDLNLTLKLTGVTMQDAGKWQLLLTNDEDSGHTYFMLFVIQDDKDASAVPTLHVSRPHITDESEAEKGVTKPNRADQDDDEDSRQSDSSAVVTVAVSLTIAVVVIVVVIVVSLKKRCNCLRVYKSRPVYEEPEESAKKEMCMEEPGRHRPSVPSQHIYCDVQEVMVRPAGQGCLEEDAYDVTEQPTYEQTSAYALLNPTYQPLRIAYDNFRKLSRRLSRGLSRRRSDIDAADEN